MASDPSSGGGAPPAGGGSRDYRITQAPLGDIFGPPSIFVIPDYTRAFSWPLAQVQTLIEDLKMAAQGTSEQFLGTFTFAHQATQGEPPEVVDGQQRMVVIFLVLSYLHTWAASNGLHDLRACLWRCLCHDQGTSVDGSPWVTYRLNFAHQAIAKFFKENMLISYMPVVFVEAEGHPVVPSNTMGAIPLPNKLMWHLYQTASHVKRHLETMLHAPNGAVLAERLVVHILSKCFVVAVLCQGKERGPAIFAHLNSTGLPLNSNDCLKAKLLAKLPQEHHQSFLAKWREMEEILGTSDIRKFLEYVKQLEEFMGTMPQLQDAYQYFSLKIASVDNSKTIVDGIFSHASVFIQRTKLKRLHEMTEAASQVQQQQHHAGAGGSQHGLPLYHQFQMQQGQGGPMILASPATSSAAQIMRTGSYQQMPSAVMAVPGAHPTTVHGGSAAKAALEAAAMAEGTDAFSTTAPARLQLLAAASGGNPDIMNTLLTHHLQQQQQQQQQQAGDGSQHGGGSVHAGGSVHSGSIMDTSQHGGQTYMQRSHSISHPQQMMDTSHHGGQAMMDSSQHGPGPSPPGQQQQGTLTSPLLRQQGAHSPSPQGQHAPLHQGPANSSSPTVGNSDDPFNWCPGNATFDDTIFKNDN